MGENQSLGEEKIGACAWCQEPFAKKRWDQKFCRRRCSERGKTSHSTPWKERPDRAEMNAARKARYHANREAICEKARRDRQENPDKWKAKDREDYQRNKEAHNKRAAKYKKSHPEVGTKSYRTAREKRPWEWPLINARGRSQKKGFAFDLTREWCEAKWTGTCALSGLPFSFGSQDHHPFSPSIDRIESSKGYTQDNCRFVLFAVNSFKGTGTDEQMLEIANALILLSKSRTQ